MNTDEKRSSLSIMAYTPAAEQRVRENARLLYAALILCKLHLEQTNWESDEVRLNSADAALRICGVALDWCHGVKP